MSTCSAITELDLLPPCGRRRANPVQLTGLVEAAMLSDRELRGRLARADRRPTRSRTRAFEGSCRRAVADTRGDNVFLAWSRVALRTFKLEATLPRRVWDGLPYPVRRVLSALLRRASGVQAVCTCVPEGRGGRGDRGCEGREPAPTPCRPCQHQSCASLQLPSRRTGKPRRPALLRQRQPELLLKRREAVRGPVVASLTAGRRRGGRAPSGTSLAYSRTSLLSGLLAASGARGPSS